MTSALDPECLVPQARAVPHLICLTISSTLSHWRWPTWDGPRHAAPMQKRVLPDSRALRAACTQQRAPRTARLDSFPPDRHPLEDTHTIFNIPLLFNPTLASMLFQHFPAALRTWYTSSKSISFSAFIPVSLLQLLLWLQ